MAQHNARYATLAEWVEREAVAFSPADDASVAALTDRLVAALGADVDLLGFGEGLHGGEDILILRNRLFRRLVEAHGYSAIAVESSFPRSRLVNDYVARRGPASYDAVRDGGFSHGFGRLDANRELIAWMRAYNADPANGVALRFYGFDGPFEMTGTDSPRPSLDFALDYLADLAEGGDGGRREPIEAALGEDAAWENPAAMMDPAAGIGLSAAAITLRIETEELIAQLQIHRPALIAAGGADRYWEAWQYAIVARQVLNYHAGLARPSERRISDLLGIRDALMADTLAYTVARERGRGKVLAFAQNRHLQYGLVEWQLGPYLNRWWPAGAQMATLLGARYAVVGTGVGVSAENGIGQPEPRTLEALLTSGAEGGCLIPTHGGRTLAAETIAALPTRSGSAKNSMYMPLDRHSFTDFDWLVVLPTTAYVRGGPPLP